MSQDVANTETMQAGVVTQRAAYEKRLKDTDDSSVLPGDFGAYQAGWNDCEKHEAEKTQFELIVGDIKGAPMTWMPALLAETIEATVKKRCLKDREAFIKFCELWYDRAQAKGATNG